MKKTMILLSAGLFILCTAEKDLQGKDSVSTAFGNMARNIRVNRNVQDQLEDQARIVEYAVRRQQLTASEKRKVESMMRRVRLLHEKTMKRGDMTPKEARNIQQQISRIYRTLWFLRINEIGKSQSLHFLGKKIVLRQPYRDRLRSSSPDQDEIREILHTYYKACRVREQLKETRLTEKDKLRIKRECFTILSEYFTLAHSPEQKTFPRRKK